MTITVTMNLWFSGLKFHQYEFWKRKLPERGNGVIQPAWSHPQNKYCTHITQTANNTSEQRRNLN